MKQREWQDLKKTKKTNCTAWLHHIVCAALSVAHDIMCRTSIPSDDTQEIRQCSSGGGREQSKVNFKVKQEHSGVSRPRWCCQLKTRGPRFHCFKKKKEGKVSNTPTASSHVSSHLFRITRQPLLAHRRVSSAAQIRFADVQPSGIKQLW